MTLPFRLTEDKLLSEVRKRKSEGDCLSLEGKVAAKGLCEEWVVLGRVLDKGERGEGVGGNAVGGVGCWWRLGSLGLERKRSI